MTLLRQYKLEITLGIILASLFLFSRLYNILVLPIFTDEAIYIRWSQIARYDASWRFISLTDGKQPALVWLTMVVMRFVEDPLLAGRLVSVGAGLASMVGLFFLGKELFGNKWVGFTAAFLYLIFPMALVYDRMALYDSLVGTFAIWSLYFEILLVRHLRLDVALSLGMILGGGVLTKTSGFFNIYLLPFSLLLFDLRKKWLRLAHWIGLGLLAVIMGYAYYSVLRLSPFFHIISEKNTIFVYPLHDWISHPFEFLKGNLLGEWDWFIKYTTWPIIGLMAGSFLIGGKYLKEKLLLLIWFIVPFVVLALFGRVLYPRFILFMILPLLPLAAVSLVKIATLIKNKILLVACCLLLIVPAFRSGYYILINFAEASIPYSDLEQYINSWPAGGGVKEIITFLEREAVKGKIYVASEGTFGSLPTYAVEIYLGDNKNIEKSGIWPIPKDFPKDLEEKVKVMPVYFIFNQTQEPSKEWPIILISKYQKGKGNSYVSLYRVEVK